MNSIKPIITGFANNTVTSILYYCKPLLLKIFDIIVLSKIMFEDNLKKCKRGSSNWQIINELCYNNVHEIHYIVHNEKFRISYISKNEDIIKFPLYTEEELTNRPICKTGIIYAEYEGNDITKIVKEFAGPLYDFYNKKGLKMRAKFIIMSAGLVCNDTNKLVITDRIADEYKYSPDDYIIFSNKYLC